MEISRLGQEFQTVRTAAAKAPDIRADKVAAIRESMAAGYAVRCLSSSFRSILFIGCFSDYFSVLSNFFLLFWNLVTPVSRRKPIPHNLRAGIHIEVLEPFCAEKEEQGKKSIPAQKLSECFKKLGEAVDDLDMDPGKFPRSPLHPSFRHS